MVAPDNLWKMNPAAAIVFQCTAFISIRVLFCKKCHSFPASNPVPAVMPFYAAFLSVKNSKA